MINEKLLDNVRHAIMRLKIMAKLPDRPDVTDWSRTLVDLCDRRISPMAIRAFTAEEQHILTAISELRGDHSASTMKTMHEPMPAGTMFPYLFNAPMFIVERLLKLPSLEFDKQSSILASKAEIDRFLKTTTIAPFEFASYQKRNWSWTMTEVSTFLWSLRANEPVLFHLLICREYAQAEAQFPWLTDKPSDCAPNWQSSFFPTAKCSLAIVMRSVGHAQRFKEIVTELAPFQALSVRDLKALSLEANPQDRLDAKFTPGLEEYLASVGTSALGLRKVLMIDCFRPEHLPAGNTLDQISRLVAGERLKDKTVMGLGPNQTKDLLAHISEEISLNAPTCRHGGNDGQGNSAVERERGSGGNRAFLLGTYYGFTLKQIACRFVLDIAHASNSPRSHLASVGQFAQRMLDEAGVVYETHLSQANNAHAIFEDAYRKRSTNIFGSPSSMASFDVEKWTNPSSHWRKWSSLADGSVTSNPDQAHFRTTRNYLQGFWYKAWMCHDLVAASKVWAHLAHGVAPLSLDPLWQMIRKCEERFHRISFKALRKSSEPPGQRKGRSKPISKDLKRRDNRLRAWEDLLLQTPKRSSANHVCERYLAQRRL